MENYYKILGVTSKANADEIRRAYRILARRYHPDVNPGRQSEERFKVIAAAYAVLGDATKRAAYDAETSTGEQARSRQRAYRQYEEQYAARRRYYDAEKRAQTRVRPSPTSKVTKPKVGGVKKWFRLITALSRKFSRQTEAPNKQGYSTPSAVSVIEVLVTFKEAICGIQKSIEIRSTGLPRKITVKIPPGVRSGSVIHLKSRSTPNEEMVVIVKVASDTSLSVTSRGIISEIPITVTEALAGASITVPTLDEPAIIKIPPGSQSGDEIRLKEKGAPLKNGGRGDILVRLLIKVPGTPSAHGLIDKARAIDDYYESSVRRGLKATLLD